VTREVLLGFFVLPALAFSLGYFPALNRLTVALVSPYARADVRKRLSAAAIDGLLVATSAVFAQLLQSPWSLAAGGLYLLLRDSVQGQSLGKLFFGLVVSASKPVGPQHSGARCGATSCSCCRGPTFQPHFSRHSLSCAMSRVNALATNWLTPRSSRDSASRIWFARSPSGGAAFFPS
jgi:hypothetical protein